MATTPCKRMRVLKAQPSNLINSNASAIEVTLTLCLSMLLEEEQEVKAVVLCFLFNSIGFKNVFQRENH